MKKSILILFTFIPIIIGYLINITILIPIIGMMIFYIVPFFTLGFWFYLGIQYSKTTWNAISSILIGNATGISSLILYIWQFEIKNDESRNIFLALFSQMFSASIPTHLFVKFVMIFESQPNFAGQITMVGMQVISVVFMIAVFSTGYFWGKKH